MDNSIDILNVWIESVKDQYHSVHTQLETLDEAFPEERGIADWTDSRFTHVINQREAGLMYARKIWADYILVAVTVLYEVNSSSIKFCSRLTQTYF